MSCSFMKTINKTGKQKTGKICQIIDIIFWIKIERLFVMPIKIVRQIDVTEKKWINK